MASGGDQDPLPSEGHWWGDPHAPRCLPWTGEPPMPPLMYSNKYIGIDHYSDHYSVGDVRRTGMQLYAW